MIKIKTDFKEGDILSPEDLNDAFTVVSAVYKLLQGNIPFATVAGQELKYNSKITIPAKEVTFDASKDNIDGTVGKQLNSLEQKIASVSGMPVTILDKTDVDLVTSHGMYFIPEVTDHAPDECTRAYLWVIKTTYPSFFIQMIWTDRGGYYTRSYIDGKFTPWK